MHSDTRCGVIFRYVDLAMRFYARTTRENFAQAVVDLYHERTPLHLRSVQFHEYKRGDDIIRVLRANAQILFRMAPDGPTRLCVELEESIVLALPQPYQRECLRELAERFGLMAADQPSADPRGAVVQLGDLTISFGDVLTRLSATIGDGLLDLADARKAPAAIAALNDLVERACTVRATHQQLLDEIAVEARA